MIKPSHPGFRPSENHTTALRARKCIPLWWLAPPPFRPVGKRVTGFSVAYGSLRIQFPCHRKRGHYGCLVMWPCLCRKAWKSILPPEQGAVRRSRIGGGERSEPISRILITPYDTVRQARNADFISIAREGNPQPSARRAVKLTNPPALRPVHPKNPFPQPFYTTFGAKGPVNLPL